MSYKVLLNTSDKSDCELCIFRGKCKTCCPLNSNWYFGSEKSKKLDIVDVWSTNYLFNTKCESK